MVLALQDVDHVSHVNLQFLALVGYDANTGCHHKYLVAFVDVPTRGGPAFKIHHAAVEVLAGALG